MEDTAVKAVKDLEKHEDRLKYLKLQRKKLNSKIRSEVMAIQRIKRRINEGG